MQEKKTSKCKYIMFQCYGMEKIADAATPPDEASYRELCTKFNLRMEDMVRPNGIDLLISMRRNRYHPKPVKTKGNMTHYRGPFGSVFGGTEPGLMFDPYVLNGLLQARYQTLRAVVKSVTEVSSDHVEKDLRNLIEEDSIAVKCNPTRTKVDDGSDFLSSEGLTGVLLRRAHPPELGKDLEWQK